MRAGILVGLHQQFFAPAAVLCDLGRVKGRRFSPHQLRACQADPEGVLARIDFLHEHGVFGHERLAHVLQIFFGGGLGFQGEGQKHRDRDQHAAAQALPALIAAKARHGVEPRGAQAVA
ncbi:hypothetical protein EGU54_04245 [Achromobacter aegrifaciens]|nr:hypothetical protein EGU54_04245 [Achromobacter aegrifaciens]